MISPGTNTTSIAACASMDFPQSSLARPQLPEIYKYSYSLIHRLSNRSIVKKMVIVHLLRLILNQRRDVLN